MAKYRYAKSNGEFPRTRFLEQAEFANSNLFTVTTGYNLTFDFISGSDVSTNNSFISEEVFTGYTARRSLVGWWRLDTDVSSAGNVPDSSTNSNPGTFDATGDRPSYTTTYLPSRYIQRASNKFDGTDDAVNIGSAATWNAIIGDDSSTRSTRKMSFSFWVYKLGSGGAGNGRLIDFGSGDAILYTSTTHRVYFNTVWNGNIVRWYTAVDAVPLSTWTHVVVTYDATSAANDPIIYVNGAAQSLTESGTTPTGSWNGIKVQDCYVGNRSNEDRAFDGYLADAAVWSSVLTANDVNNIYGATVGVYRLVRKFDQISPQNDTRLLGVKTDAGGIDVSGLPADTLDGMRQGVNIVSNKQLSSYISFKIRPNSGFITTLNGKDTSARYFDDLLTPSPGQSKTNFTFFLGPTEEGDGGTVTRSTYWGPKTYTWVEAGYDPYVSGSRNDPTLLDPTGSRPLRSAPFGPVGADGVVINPQPFFRPLLPYVYKAPTPYGFINSNHGFYGGRPIFDGIGGDGETSADGFLLAGSASVGAMLSPRWSMESGSQEVPMGTAGRVSSRLSHYREQRDLGQTPVYVNVDGFEAFEDTLDLNPITIISKNPENIILPWQLLVQASNPMTDGAIEPLTIRSRIDHSSIEQPFFAHEIRASLGGITDAFRRSIIVTNGWDLDDPEEGTAPYLDSVETFLWTTVTGSQGYPTVGSLALITSGVNMPGAFSTDFATVAPWVDYFNDREKEYTTNDVSTTISNTMISASMLPSASFSDNDLRVYDKMAPAGFIFDNDPIGIDSIVYGGLKK